MPIHQADCSGSPFASQFQTVWLSPTSQDATARKEECQKPGSRPRWISSWNVVSWDATVHLWGRVGRPGGLSLTLVCASGTQSPVPPCAEVNSCKPHNNTSRGYPAENRYFSQVSSLQQAHISSSSYSRATLALVLAQGK